MNFFFEPNGVAVVGATPEPHTSGHSLLTNISLGYKGPIYPVNPKYDEILGFKSYPRVSDITGPLDLALILVPSQAVPQILEECITKGVRGAIIESGGFAEVGPEGKALQDRCLAIARRGGIRVWGPNCMGLLDIERRYIFSFIVPEIWQENMNPGHVSMIVQSGLLSAGFITTLMGNKTLGLAKVCSIGNKSDVEESELLEYLLKDPATKVVALYLESFIHGRRFFELAASSDKPIVVLKGAKGTLGAEASASHTASLAGNYDLIRGVLKQAGVHQADDFFEMVDMARALEKGFHLNQPSQGKARIAVFTYSGSAGIVTTDHIEKYDLTLARLSPETRKQLEELSPPWMPVKNPVDYWPAAEKHGPLKTYKHAIETLYHAPEVDGVIAHIPTVSRVWSPNMKEVMSVIKEHRKPILFWLIGPEKIREITRSTLEEEGWPTFYEINRAVRVMSTLSDQSKHAKKSSQTPSIQFSTPQALSELAQQADERKATVLDEYESKKWLQALGLKVVKEVVVKDINEAIRAAKEIGYPVVLKGRIEGQIHKTEAGLVKLNLWTEDHLRSAYQEMSNLKPKPESFLIQTMLKGDFELIVGITRDPQFGPAAMLGLGGIWTEVYRDVAFRLVPLNQQEVSEMVSELKGKNLFKGYRGSKPVNMESLSEWLIRLGWLAMNFDRIKEMDVNPLVIVDGEPVAVDANIILQ